MPKELILVESWLCHVDVEKLAKEEALTADEFFAEITAFNIAYENAMEQFDTDEEEPVEVITVDVISVSPNPNS